MTVYYEDLEVGQVVECGQYVMERGEMLDFARKWDPRPFHVDEVLAKGTLFGGIIGSGIQSLAVYVRLLNEFTADWAVSGALGYESLRFAKATRPGDVLTARSEVLSLRPSNSRPGYGVGRNRDTLTNQHGDMVLDLTVAYLIERRP